MAVAAVKVAVVDEEGGKRLVSECRPCLRPVEVEPPLPNGAEGEDAPQVEEEAVHPRAPPRVRHARHACRAVGGVDVLVLRDGTRGAWGGAV